jgi:amidophosphoribosyltransferase
LVASGRSDEEVARLIGADWLVYQDLEDLVSAVRHDKAQVDSFDTSCFSGVYVTHDVTDAYLSALEAERSDGAKARRRDDAESGGVEKLSSTIERSVHAV